MSRHWSFVVCDKRYGYTASLLLLAIGFAISLKWRVTWPLGGAGALVGIVGVVMTMRQNFREGLNRHKNSLDSSPVVPGTNQLNVTYFNNIGFGLGDARLQRHGLVLIGLGTIVWAFADVLLQHLFPGRF